jgi:hypothetical protein
MLKYLHDLWPNPELPISPLLVSVPPLSELLESAEWLDFVPPDLRQMRTYTSTRYERRQSRTAGRPTKEAPELPEWLPGAIRDKASSIFAALMGNGEDEEGKELLIRLASDPRMMNVWEELYKKNRDANEHKEFVYAPSFWQIGSAHTTRLTAVELGNLIRDAEDRSVELDFEEQLTQFLGQLPRSVIFPLPKDPVDPQARQDLAARYIFHHAYLSARIEPSVLTVKEIVRGLSERTAMAHEMLELAHKLRSFGMENDALALIRIARNCETNVDILCDRWIVGRDRSPSHLRAYVITLAELTRKLFGNPLCGTLAFIANVAFDLADTNSITDVQVREMLRGADFTMERSGP